MSRVMLVGLVSAVVQLIFWHVPLCQGIADSFIVSVPGGRVQGTLRSGAVHFMGIPYAIAHRFQYPFPSVSAWQGIRNASHPGPQCPQSCPPVIRDLYCLPDDQSSESCLTLNIFRPAYNLPSDQAFPVMVFIHGGGFQSGSGGAPLYTGDYLARVGGVILVTINYRLGALGFLPIFNSYDDVIGNFGFRDQQVALQWVKRNIANFEGDPNKVTLVGEEAGCQSVGLHLTSFNSDPFFHAAIMHSCPFTLPFRSKIESHQMAADFAKALGCNENDVTCLRRKSVDAILQAQRRVSDGISSRSASLGKFQVWGPTVDKSNVYYSNLLEEVTRANMVNAKPIMLGYVSEEGKTTVYREFPLPVTNSYYEGLVRSMFPDKWGQIAGTAQAPYHSNTLTDARTQMVRFLDDFVYICPAHRFATEVEKSFLGGSPKLWMYEFEAKVMWSPGGSAWPPGGETYCRNDVCQGLDLLYLFNPSTIPKTQRVRTAGLTKAMTLYWTNFVKHHNPNGLRDSFTSPQGNPTVQGSLLHSRGIGFVSPFRPASVGPLLPRSFHLPASFKSLLHVSSVSNHPFSSPIYFPPRPQRHPIFGSPLMLPSSLSSNRYAVGSMLAKTRQSSSTRASSKAVAWPTYVTQHPDTSVDVNATLVLTQPKPQARGPSPVRGDDDDDDNASQSSSATVIGRPTRRGLSAVRGDDDDDDNASQSSSATVIERPTRRGLSAVRGDDDDDDNASQTSSASVIGRPTRRGLSPVRYDDGDDDNASQTSSASVIGRPTRRGLSPVRGDGDDDDNASQSLSASVIGRPTRRGLPPVRYDDDDDDNASQTSSASVIGRPTRRGLSPVRYDDDDDDNVTQTSSASVIGRPTRRGLSPVRGDGDDDDNASQSSSASVIGRPTRRGLSPVRYDDDDASQSSSDDRARDYVTEKFFKTFTVDVVPIVRGATNYTRYFPPGTFINTADYSGPKQLAEHLKTLIADRKAYIRLLETKDRFFVVDKELSICELCEHLHTSGSTPKMYPDFMKWTRESTCNPPSDI
ncbi:hypothetical protein ACOMHN_029050 [Nucella lapillus]